MRIIRSLAAVLAGLGFMAATTTVGMLVASLALGRETPEVRLTPRAFSTFLFLNLVFCGIGGIFGGWLTARIGSSAPYAHAASLAALVALVSIDVAMAMPTPGQPGWYPSVLGVVAVTGVLLGGKLRAAASQPLHRIQG
jgi:peptidoglycan/LPS O-acetylase OafA/YrhL